MTLLLNQNRAAHSEFHLVRNARNPVFGMAGKVRLKPVCSATKTSWTVEILPEVNLDIILYK